MKLRDLISGIDRRPNNKAEVDVDEICQELGINVDPWGDDFDREKFESSVTAYWARNWNCTDTWVGTKIVFLNWKPVCVTNQVARKSDTEYAFIGLDQAKALKEFVLSCVKSDGSPQVRLCNLEQEMGDGFKVHYTNELLHDKVMYEGKLVPVDREATRVISLADYIAKSVAIVVDGEVKTVAIEDVTIPFNLDPTPP